MGGLHSAQSPSVGGVHVTQAFDVVDAAARLALPLTALDVGKVVRQTGDNTFWLIKTVGPTTFGPVAEVSTTVYGTDRQVIYVAAETFTTSTAYQTKAILNTPTLTGSYEVSWRALINVSNTVGDAEVRLQDVTNGVTIGMNPRIEVQDAANRVPVQDEQDLSFSSESRSLELQYRILNGATVGIENARIKLIRVG